jgi:hypothetical protein
MTVVIVVDVAADELLLINESTVVVVDGVVGVVDVAIAVLALAR